MEEEEGGGGGDLITTPVVSISVLSGTLDLPRVEWSQPLLVERADK